MSSTYRVVYRIAYECNNCGWYGKLEIDYGIKAEAHNVTCPTCGCDCCSKRLHNQLIISPPKQDNNVHISLPPLPQEEKKEILPQKAPIWHSTQSKMEKSIEN